MAGDVSIWDVALRGGAYFKLYSFREILEFIAQGGLEEPRYRPPAKLLENNRTPEVEKWVVAYDFISGQKGGYIAFCKSPATGIWEIKSLKKSDDPILQARASRRRASTARH